MPEALPFLPRRRARLAPLLVPLLLALGVAVVTAAWILLATATGRQSSWMALLAAADAAFLLRVCGVAPGFRRVAWAVGATALTIVLANWGIIAAGIGRLVGVGPLDSAMKLGTGLAWTVAQLANGPVDVALLLASLVVAALAAR
ncbi:MAG TPA: hypothetical protein VFS99_03750 [Xanthomonadaceae bacterium]|nr:hypothetical protein [Xanthomonadaceae bacterium]